MRFRHCSWLLMAAGAFVIGACSESAQAPTSATAESAPAAAAPVAPGATDGAAAVAKRGLAVTSSKRTRKPSTSKVTTPEVPFEGRRIALVHTANVVGELEPCG